MVFDHLWSLRFPHRTSWTFQVTSTTLCGRAAAVDFWLNGSKSRLDLSTLEIHWPPEQWFESENRLLVPPAATALPAGICFFLSRPPENLWHKERGLDLKTHNHLNIDEPPREGIAVYYYSSSSVFSNFAIWSNPSFSPSPNRCRWLPRDFQSLKRLFGLMEKLNLVKRGSTVVLTFCIYLDTAVLQFDLLRRLLLLQ